ncbi:acyl-CoA carboxylase subunit epsilon [Saccharothrix obliqua]|uniref:acyl-CoA carboxylase subunit epsilon n=1 Tax=Saccharothrix obliqua TaxID=2861747 RepID=UPI001C5FF5E7|nr:acyl-CoA carboxylase subunit epsilon [Saccharothrix obliqua]MBW4718302.1 acyl-CoA carboxylase subunit epsilon [Saccharothrix obliqua]
MTAPEKTRPEVVVPSPRPAPATRAGDVEVAGAPADAEPALLVRVVKGEPDLVELAALAAVLRRHVAEEPPPAGPGRRSARWRRPERAGGFAGARSWRD